MVHTGTDFIAANTPVFWSAPDEQELKDQPTIRGMPPDAVYPTIKAYSQENLASIMADALTQQEVKVNNQIITPANELGLDNKDATKEIIKKLIRKKMSAWRRVIGWTLNDCEPGKYGYL